MCIRNLAKRDVKMSAELGERTEVVELVPGQSPEDYKSIIDEFCDRVADYHRQQ